VVGGREVLHLPDRAGAPHRAGRPAPPDGRFLPAPPAARC